MDDPPIKPEVFKTILVGTSYDEFTLEEAGFHEASTPPVQLDEENLQTGRWLQHLEMDNIFRKVERPGQVLELLQKETFDIVICDIVAGGECSIDLNRKIKQLYPGTRLCLLTSNPGYAGPRETWPLRGGFDLVLTWHGNGQLLRSIVLLHKDARAARDEQEEYRPRAIMLVEDEPGLAGLYLPLIHEEIFNRMRDILPARPPGDLLRKILAERPRLFYATTCEEAETIVRKHGSDLLGVITDVRFPRMGRLDPDAGFELTKFVRRLHPTLPVAIQSRDPDERDMASALRAHFMLKEPARLLSRLKRFMIDYLGFGPFIFRMPDGREVARASTLEELAEAFARCPLESFLYHAGNNHFSAWLALHGCRPLAVKLAPLKARSEKDRRHALGIIRQFIAEHQYKCRP
jgi:DNA-binding NarL/FixJ family response regulator